MAIVKMNKFLLLAFENQREALLKKFQAFENVHISEICTEDFEELAYLKKQNSSVEISEVEGVLSKLSFIINLLEQHENKPNIIKAMKEGKKTYTYSQIEEFVATSNWESIYLELQQKSKIIHQNENELSRIAAQKHDLEGWLSLDVMVDSLKVLKLSKAMLGSVPSSELNNARLKLENDFNYSYMEALGESGRDTNVLIIAHIKEAAEVEMALKASGFVKAQLSCKRTPMEEFKAYEASVSKLKKENNLIKEEMKEYLKELDSIKGVYEYYSLNLIRLKSTEKFLRSKSIIAIEGYYPTDLNKEVESLISEVLGNSYYFETMAASGDQVPVLLKNNRVVRSFESITHMYAVPRYEEIDPTPLFAPFYIFFFGMMLSDAAYGVLISLGTFIALKYFNLEDDTKQFMRMFFYLGLSTIFWGVMYGSYFGDFFDQFFEVKALWMKPDSNVALLMIVSVAMGLVQILAGLGIKAYMQIKSKDYFGAFADVFLWYVTLIGCIIWGLSAFGFGVPGALVNISKYSALAAMVGIVLTNGRQEASLGGKLGQGFYSLYGITGYVGDLVSYTRLAALGLATGFISYAFNVMLDMVSFNLVSAIVFGGSIFIIGHVFNLFINALGSYVHTSRLQYLEFFGKFYEGGGQAFEPLKYKSKYFKIIKG